MVAVFHLFYVVVIVLPSSASFAACCRALHTHRVVLGTLSRRSRSSAVALARSRRQHQLPARVIASATLGCQKWHFWHSLCQIVPGMCRAHASSGVRSSLLRAAPLALSRDARGGKPPNSRSGGSPRCRWLGLGGVCRAIPVSIFTALLRAPTICRQRGGLPFRPLA